MTTPSQDEQRAPERTANGRSSPDGPPVRPPNLESREVIHGTKPGDVAVRVRRLRGFRRHADGLEVTDEALEPQSGLGRITHRIRTTLFGRPLATNMEVHERMSKVMGL